MSQNVSKRDSAKKSIVKQLKYINNVAETDTETCIKARYHQLETQWSRFCEIHELIIDVTGTQEIDNQKAEYDNCEDVYLECVNKFANKLDTYKVVQNDKVDESDSDDDSSSASRNTRHGNNAIRLPKISLPVFSGGYSEWQSFRDLFQSMVHDNNALGNAQKLHYLKSSLIGEAECLLKNVLITNANYEESWKLLQRRYENQRVIVYTLIDKIVKQPVVSANAESIKTMLDTTTTHLRALQNLEQPVKHWDSWITYTIVQKLDPDSKQRWEESIATSTTLPKWTQLETFLLARFRTLEGSVPQSEKKTTGNLTERIKSFLTTSEEKCCICSEQHRLYRCERFLERPTGEKREIVRSNRLCFNCMSPNHHGDRCRSSRRCQTCRRRHHTLLHDNTYSGEGVLNQNTPTAPTDTRSFRSTTMPTISSTSSPSSFTSPQQTSENAPAPVISSLFAKGTSSYLLATALIAAVANDGRKHIIRALIDPGSMTSFITTATSKALGLVQQQTSVAIEGVGCTRADRPSSTVSFEFSSCVDNEKTFSINAYVLGKITNMLPTQRTQWHDWRHLNDLQLADPKFFEPGQIHALLGADIYPSIIESGVIKGAPGSPIAQNTALGYIITGASSQQPPQSSSLFSFHCQAQTDDILRKFWEFEEVPTERYQSIDDEACIQHYHNTTSRTASGTYIVRLPFKKHPETHLGNSRDTALQRMYQLERRFSNDSTLRKEYERFIDEYMSLRHMEIVPEADVATQPKKVYYMPHHAIIKESSTTRLRVVFDASHKSSSGASLNDLMYSGPTLQQNLFSIITRWRKHLVAFTADVEKMYRQILIHPDDRNFQRILWRRSTAEKVQDYRLSTVTYGTSAAPFLAIKTLQTLASDERERYPEAAKVALRDMYVDDVCSGADDLTSALEIQHQLREMFRAGGFQLRKWTSNFDEVLQNVPEECREYKLPTYITSDNTIKALGIAWNPSTDLLEFKVKLDNRQDKPTKRSLLSDASTLFDPLGWLAPTVIIAKALFQQLWLLGLKWDDYLPEPICSKWLNYRNNLSQLEDVRVPRWLCTHKSQKHCELHGFCDASNIAYAAAVYIRVVFDDDSIQVRLVAAKTKVAPIKQVSLPRLELCGAVLLARTMNMVKAALELETVATHSWSDSEIVLAWLRSNPCRWKTFIANRTSEIQTSLTNNMWHHISSAENPADCASRGIPPNQLKNHHLWWTGPKWLSQHSASWPTTTVSLVPETSLEERNTIIVSAVSTVHWDLPERCSTFTRLVRVTAYCLRFIQNSHQSNRTSRYRGFVTSNELQVALQKCIKITQFAAFYDEFTCLQSGKPLKSNSKLISLNPFIDENAIIRVGGRLHNSKLSPNQIHPIVIPRNGRFSKLLMEHAHLSTLHGSAQQTLQYLRRNYWPLDGRNQIRRTIHRCNICFRHTPRTGQQIMATLPEARVAPSPAFLHTGIDYAGPIHLKANKGRCRTVMKGYIALFVCMCTKAIHLEAVSDLSTPSFIAAFKRFNSRHIACRHIYSDNGTNFVGAATEIPRQQKKAMREQQQQFAEILANDLIEWHFNPPSAPHFGGLWEAGVKSVKHHLRRITGNANLTFEEISTVLCQIEAALNSRPLCRMTDDIADEEAITPGHLAFGYAPRTVPEPSLLEVQENRLTRWQHLQQMYQHFWKRWSDEYLSRLQQRPKWKAESIDFKIGDIVLVKDENFPPAKWPLARIVRVHPGSDKRVRVVTIRIRGKEQERPITKLCLLPNQP